MKIIMRDRPNMTNYLSPGDPIWNWCSRQLAGEYTGSRYFWKNDFPPSLIGKPGAMHSGPNGKIPGFVWVVASPGKTGLGESQCAGLIFELFKMRSDPAFKAWWHHRGVGKMNSDEFADQAMHLEYEAMKARLTFYKSAWCSHSKSKKFVSNPDCWYTDLPSTYKEWRDSMPSDFWYKLYYQ